MTFFDIVKKYTIFVQKLITKYLQNTKKIFTPWKSSKSQLSNNIKFSSNSRNDKDMVKTKKVAERGGLFFVPNCISKNIRHMKKISSDS